MLEEDLEDGLQIEFVGFEDIDLAFERLPRERSGIELYNVRREGSTVYATVFVPLGRLEHFERMIQDYLDERLDSAGRPRDNRALIDTIRDIRAATVRALWTDDPKLLPTANNQPMWWEVWLPVRRDRAQVIRAFRKLAEEHEIRVLDGEVHFRERTVLLAHAAIEQLTRSSGMLSLIAELRHAKETAAFFVSLSQSEQKDWVDDLLRRTQYADPGPEVPYVCLLDTGVNRGHPLIAQALDEADLHTIEPGWGAHDVEGHGTEMAGLALFGDLTPVLEQNASVRIDHRLESVKLLHRDGGNQGTPDFHGYLTMEAIGRVEVSAPDRRRVFSLSITAEDYRGDGRPSAWSAAIDALAADVDGDGKMPRLIIAAAGNINDLNEWREYPDSCTRHRIHDPGQAWNALTVGAYTDLILVDNNEAPDYQPIASAGGLSPFSTTSAQWGPIWPLKPDVVFEGGNAARDRISPAKMDCLSLLTTSHEPQSKLLATAEATSAATQLVARMAATLMATYPELRPETIRALIVHSASWTAEMRRMYLGDREPTKSDYIKLVRHCGFGVANLDRAMWSASNSVTLVIEQQLQPYTREPGRPPTLGEMHFHRLPWPRRELEALGETEVELRVTLSYYIEPNPSNRGRSRYRYESHGLRFDVMRPDESEKEFRGRVNEAARDETDSGSRGGNDRGWALGINGRHRGSLHSDIWRGTAADLARRGVLAVYPVSGWWKTRPRLECWNKRARYSLVVSIHAPEVEVDLYTAVRSAIETPVAVEV